jgi:uncharacterized protein YjbK
VSESLEQELKFRLEGSSGFRRAVEFLGPVLATVEQVNHYFGAPGGQVSPLWSLRVRQEDQGYELTLKSGRQQRDGYFEASELTCPLSDEQAELLLTLVQWPEELQQLEPVQKLREQFGVAQPAYLGCLQNQRHKCQIHAWGQPELDITSFPDGSVEYELEIETAQPQEAAAYLQPLAAVMTPQKTTKFRRFLERRGV